MPTPWAVILGRRAVKRMAAFRVIVSVRHQATQPRRNVAAGRRQRRLPTPSPVILRPRASMPAYK